MRVYIVNSTWIDGFYGQEIYMSEKDLLKYLREDRKGGVCKVKCIDITEREWNKILVM